MRRAFWFGLACALSGSVGAAEVTIKNDSLTDFGNAAIVYSFNAGEMAASWLTSPCDGNLVAVQIFWRSPAGTSAATIANAIHIYRSGTFPEPGVLAQDIGGPVLNDNALNEWRYLDENNTLPLSVAVSANETLVIALEFPQNQVPNEDPSVVRDTDGNTAGHNALYGDIGLGPQWYNSAALGVQGDWVIRGVVNCQAGSNNANVGVTMNADQSAYTAGSPLQYTIVVANAGPAAANGVTLVDTFPSAYQTPNWTCLASTGATCPAGGNGNIIGAANLPSGGQITFTVNGTVASGTTGTLGNSMTAVVNVPAVDPDTSNNTATLNLEAAPNDLIFKNGFDSGAGRMIPAPARALGRRGS
ncbi:MAG: DUF11 domain-containing protein [Dokdonella sp.]|uniref:hypothetical protein n=1 Tax=Dokdonella sp. TaxID=2291710 RepID=UPI0025B8A8EE|nr:hypothetical protein [Dokdonella sp.]MBZ0221929.1 DUF11 domain-containing protein [Dokdonella sp.]